MSCNCKTRHPDCTCGPEGCSRRFCKQSTRVQERVDGCMRGTPSESCPTYPLGCFETDKDGNEVCPRYPTPLRARPSGLVVLNMEGLTR